VDAAKAWGQRLVDMMYADAGGRMCTASLVSGNVPRRKSMTAGYDDHP
jgi:hypothetical protein